MSKKKNCWEIMGCGREPGGIFERDFGTCPSATSTEYDGVNGGKNAGRACWAVAGTMSPGKPVATFVELYIDCTNCRFYKKVKKEEGLEFKALEANRKDKAA